MIANYRLGVTLVMLAGVCLSSAGLILRLIEQADGWQILFYRSIAFTLTVLIFLYWHYRRQTFSAFLRIGWHGIIVAVSLGLGFTCYVFAIIQTTVANVVFILSTGPFFAALLGWLVLRERISKITVLAIVVATAGLSLMVFSDLALGRFLGNLIALAAAASFAVMLVTIRAAKTVDMMPATCLAGVVAALLAAFMLDSFVIPLRDILLSLLMGSAQIGAGFILLTLGTRYLPAAEVALLALTETILAPLWVWFFIAEVPEELALSGGFIVLLAVVGQALYGIYRTRQQIT